MPIPARDSVADALMGTTKEDVRPAPPFLLVHHTGRAGSWEVADVDGEAVWLPVLMQIPLVPGANGVRTVERGEKPEEAYAGLVAKLRRDGAVVIPANEDVCGVRYMRAQEVQRGIRFTMFCETVSKNPMPDKKDLVTFDHGAYNKWRAELVTSGAIPAPPDAVLALVTNAAKAAVSRWRGNKSAHPETRSLRLQAAEEKANRVTGAKMPTDTKSAPSAKRGAK